MEHVVAKHPQKRKPHFCSNFMLGHI